MPNLTANVLEVKSLGCLTAPKRRPQVRDPMVVIRAGSQRRSTKVQFGAGPDASFNQHLSFYGIAAATTMWVQCYDGANPTTDALVGEMRASLADLLKYHTPKGIWLDLTESLASSRAVGRVLVVLDTDLTPAAASSSPETVSSSLLAPPAVEGGRRRPSPNRNSRTPSPSATASSESRRRPSVSPARPASRPVSSVSPTRPHPATGGSTGVRPQISSSRRPVSPSQPPTRTSRPNTATSASSGALGRRASSTPRPAASTTPTSTLPAQDHTLVPPPTSEQNAPASSALLSSTTTPADSIPITPPPAVPVAPADRLSSLSRAKHLPSPLDHLDAVTLPSAATSTSVVADTTGTTLTYSLSAYHSDTSALLSSTTPPPPSISPRRHSLAHVAYPQSAPSSPTYSPQVLPAVPPLPLMYANHTGGDAQLMGTLAMPEPTPFRYPNTGGGSPASSPRPYEFAPAGASPSMFPSPTAYAQTPHVPSPYMAPSATGRVSPHLTGAGSGGGSPASLAYPPALFRPGGEFVAMPTDLAGHVMMPACAGEVGQVPVYRGPVHFHAATPSAALMGGSGDVRRHSANAAMVQESLGRMDLNAKPLPYVPHQRPYVNPYVVPQQQ